MFKNLGVTEILIIILVVVVLFGSKRIPELARSLGKSVNEFKKGRQEGADDEKAPDEKDKA
jgi:sec-independent protein translocase protein TatA